MVNTVVVEKPQLLSAEDRLSQSGLSAQVGLLIGKLSPTLDRGFIFDFIPTPQNDAGEAACSVSKDDKKKPPSKSKSQPSDSISLVIDKDWIAEHARQVSRMLLGGIKVVGIYVWATDSAFKNSTIELCQTVNAAAKAVPILEIDSDERLLVHIGYSPRRLPIRLVGASNTQTFSDILRQGISVHANELRGAKAVVDGNFVVNDEPCSTDGLHEVELLLPLLNDTSAEACSQKDVVGLLILSGSVCSFAFLTPKEPISQAFSEIKGDIIMSLQSRLDVICDEVDEDLAPTASGGEEASNEKPVSKLILHSLRKTCGLSFPRRVFVPWLADTYICDYLQPSETLEVLKEHCVELMSMEALSDSSSILDVEVEAPSVISKSFWDVVVPFSSGGSSSSSASKGIETSKEKTEYPVKTANFNIMAAVFFLLLSILVGFVLIAKKL
ncbi:Oxidoreductase zinc-binding dehydrogenase family protein [Citrus sinensis]|uniref:Oxidoreductase zinc-binding dehydrogenase family protein n=1 Tax=Citrus sinensis TaxID=2711 RepID=A0ACB8KNQ9_CITSI|nr:Oxidoreductase zinc-binding dehydrogenase family protein [Citrus sinensis]